MNNFDWGSATPGEAEAFMTGISEPAFRARQVYEWVHRNNAKSFEEMTNLPKALRERLQAASYFQGADIWQKKEDIDGTIKYLLELKNNNIIDNGNIYIETVHMDYRYGGVVCVSTQAGCAMGCVFCESGREGLIRNLTPGEMLAQVYAASRDTGKPAAGVVLMGSGEPLNNLANVVKFIKLLCGKDGAGISQRRVTLSTCGLTDGIRDLLREKLRITLAVSLHAPNDRLRAELMPVARAYPLDGLLKACKDYGDATKRRVTFEYALADKINDSPKLARELGDKLRNMLCHVNLITVNEGRGGFKPSSEKTVEAFKTILTERGIETTVRRKLGSGINAACGQLRAHGKMERNGK